MYTADAGKAGLGLDEGRMMVPRGKMLGGSSGINYMAYVRGHPGDFDAWAEGGATGWSYDEVLPYFRKSEGLAPSDDIAIDEAAHRRRAARSACRCARRCCTARARVRRRRRKPPASRAATTTDATAAARHGVVSLLADHHADGKRSSTYHAFLEGRASQRAEPDASSPGRT